MGCSRYNGLVGVVIGASLMFSSTAAVAATSTAPVRQINPWAALAVMSGTAPAAVLCGSVAAAAATQTPGTGCVLPATETPPPVVQTEPPPPIPVPPVEAAGGGLGLDPLLLALGAILAGVGIYFLVKKKNSPA
jgi:LPXTG-motif cell wall-anchored protein